MKMVRLSVTTVCLLFLMLGSVAALASDWGGLKTKDKDIVDASGNKVILKGFGVGEWTNTEAYMLEWPDGGKKHRWYYGYTRIHTVLEDLMGPAAKQYWEMWGRNVVTEDDVDRWQRWGANSIRLSINYHWLSPSDGVYLDSGWEWIDRLVAWCKAHHLYVILCLHAAPGAQNPELMSDTVDGAPHLWTEPSIYQPWTIHLWRAIAQRYADETTVAGYDLLDEPLLSESKPASGGATVRAFYVQATTAIRNVDTHHIIFACGTAWCGSTAGMNAILPTWDNNMVLVFHKYWDRNDEASIAGYLSIREQNRVPLWNGETGENSNAWAKGMVDLLDKNGIGWSWWTYKKVNNNKSPCLIAEPPNYREVRDYVKGKGLKPSQERAAKIMLELAGNAATSNCRWNDGLIKALFGRLSSQPGRVDAF